MWKIWLLLKEAFMRSATLFWWKKKTRSFTTNATHVYLLLSSWYSFQLPRWIRRPLSVDHFLLKPIKTAFFIHKWVYHCCNFSDRVLCFICFYLIWCSWECTFTTVPPLESGCLTVRTCFKVLWYLIQTSDKKFGGSWRTCFSMQG